MKTLLIFGAGYSASHFAKQAIKEGWKVIATSRSPSDKAGMENVLFDGETMIADFADHFKNVTHVLHSIPPHKDMGDCVYNLHGGDLAKLPHLEWFGYLSTTGVYGNADGAMVDENSPCRPTSARARARLQAEECWLSSGLPVHLFRLAGIYGPGRSIFDQIRKGRNKAIVKPGHKFSRIHIDDIAGVLWASIAKPNPGAAYNLCDDHPSEPIYVLQAACKMMGLDMPRAQTFEEAKKTMTPMALTFWQDNKLVDNSRIKQELGYQLVYPDFHQALTDIFQADPHE